MWKILLFTLFPIASVSCGQVKFLDEKILLGGRGHIFSKKSGDPLDSVKVILYHNYKVVDSVYSDSTGYFNGVRWEQCFFCPKVKFEFKKPGFETTILDTDDYFSNKVDGREPPYDSIVIVMDVIDP